MRSFCSSQGSLGFQLKQPSEPYDGLGILLRIPPHLPAKMIYDFNPIKVGWKRPHGRPKKRWSDSLSEFLTIGKHQTGRRANTRQGPKWMEEADVTLYAEQCPAGDLSQAFTLSRLSSPIIQICFVDMNG